MLDLSTEEIKEGYELIEKIKTYYIKIYKLDANTDVNIKEIIVELFDNPQLPLDLKKHDRGVDFRYSFSTDYYDYCIPFKKIEANSLQDNKKKQFYLFC